jgi:hypothetical protein
VIPDAVAAAVEMERKMTKTTERRRNRHSHETQPIAVVSNLELVSHPLAYWAALDAETRQLQLQVAK